ncbi:3D domain-containing protein [Enterococcus sp. LJL98]
MKIHFLPVAMITTMLLIGAVLPVYAAENQEEVTISQEVMTEESVQDISSSFLTLATKGDAIQSAKEKIEAKEKAIQAAKEKAAKEAAEKAAKEKAAKEQAEKEAAERAAAEQAAQEQAEQEAAAASSQPAGQTFIMESTAYSSDPADALGGGTVTATGQNLLTNPMAVAVDPNVIPLGTRLYVEGYGEAIASDTGGAIKGNIVDVHFPTYEQCVQWGRRQVKVTILG